MVSLLYYHLFIWNLSYYLHFVRVNWKKVVLCGSNIVLIKIREKLYCLTNHCMKVSRKKLIEHHSSLFSQNGMKWKTEFKICSDIRGRKVWQKGVLFKLQYSFFILRFYLTSKWASLLKKLISVTMQ